MSKVNKPVIADIDAVLVTRGDVDMTEIVESLSGFHSVITWDNLKHKDGTGDLGPSGQYYAALMIAKTELVYFQDDDCVVSEHQKLADLWIPDHIVCNMPQEFRAQYETAPDKLMGFGSVLERSLILTTLARWKHTDFTISPDLFIREASRFVSGLNPCILADVPVRNLPWATGENRLYRQPDHIAYRDRMREHIRKFIEIEQSGARRD